MTFRPPKKPILTLDASLVQDDLPLEVVPKIFVGSIHSAFNLDMLQCHNISHILNASRLPVTFPKQFTYLSVEIRDKGESNILSCIPTTNIFIEAAVEDGGVLVHCFGGKSRSPAFVAAYLMSSRSWSFDEAYALIKLARPTVDINAGFECQLRAYGAASYDVYVAQQLLLRTRIRALYPLKGNESFLNSPEVKASDRIATTQSRLNRGATTSGGLSGPTYTKHDNDPDKEGTIEDVSHFSSLSSAGMKRSWVEDKAIAGGMTTGGQMMSTGYGTADSKEDEERCRADTVTSAGCGLEGMVGLRSMSTDMEESAAIADLDKRQQLGAMGASYESNSSSEGGDINGQSHSGSSNSIAFRSGGSSVSGGLVISTGASAGGGIGPNKSTRAASKGRVNRGGRSLNSNADVEAKTPSCRLSRPGSNWVRVIPPLRGLEREFKCSWCNVALFSLANVIRIDLDVLPLLDVIRAEEKQSYSRAHTPRLENMGSPGEAAAAPSRRASRAGVTFPDMGPPTPRTLAASAAANVNVKSSFSSFSNSSNTTTDSAESPVAMTLQTPRGGITPRNVEGGGLFPALSVTTPRSAGGGMQMRASFSSPAPTCSTFGGDSPVEADVEMDVDDDNDNHAIASPKYVYPQKSTRGGGAKGFSFDIPLMNFGDSSLGDVADSKNSPDAKGSGSARGALSARGVAPPSLLSPSSARSPKVSARDMPPLSARHYDQSSVSFASDSKHSGSSLTLSSKASSSNQMLARSILTSNSYGGSSLPLIVTGASSRPSSATSTSMFSYSSNQQQSQGGAVYDDSPRIQIPAHRVNESYSPGDKRPQSAEKRRWIARVNLLREGDSKVAKMADDDDIASELGIYGEDKYFYVEYLDWMGKELFAAENDSGDICCFNCHKAVGTYIWKPSVRLTLNHKLEAPLFKIHKHVVHQTDWVFDATPKNTPRVGEADPIGAQHGVDM